MAYLGTAAATVLAAEKELDAGLGKFEALISLARAVGLTLLAQDLERELCEMNAWRDLALGLLKERAT